MFECNTGQLTFAINTVIHYVLPDELHGYVFRPLSGYLQEFKAHQIKIKITRLSRMGRSRSHCLYIYINIYIHIYISM